jgi:hypothetical protein
MAIKIDTYFDITCAECARSWSTDFNGSSMSDHASAYGGMGMATDKKWLRKASTKAGWKYIDGRTLCPECAENAKILKCSIYCPYLAQYQEEYDDEPMGYCCRSTDMQTWNRRFLGSVEEIREGTIDCLF